jgi:hypothetical protein
LIIFGTVVLATVFLLGCVNNGYLDLTVEEAKNLIATKPDLVIIDVSPKYDEGYIPGSLNYYVGDGSLEM